MVKSFPIINVIKKNWKVIALLVLLLVVALLVLALYPKVQEGASQSFTQKDASDKSSTVSLTSSSSNLSLRMTAPGIKYKGSTDLSGVGVSGSGTANSYVISGLEPNIKYSCFKIVDGSGTEYANTICTLPVKEQVPVPTFSTNDLSNTHAQPDPSGVLATYIKFNTGADMSYNKGIVAPVSSIGMAFNVTSFLVSDVNNPKTKLTSTLDVNPDTGTAGWCKIIGLKPGRKCKIVVQSVCDVPSAIKTIIPNYSGKPDALQVLTGEQSKPIEFFTAPVAVTNIQVAQPTSTDNGKTYSATITFDSANGEDTYYRTKFACDTAAGYVETPATKLSDGKYQIIISNIKAGTNVTGVVNSLVDCPASVTSSPTVCKDFKCSMNVPSDKVYKKKDPNTGKFVEFTGINSFTLTTPAKK